MALRFGIRAIAWFAYRRIRLWWYTALGRNPLVRAGAAPTMAFEWRSIQGLLKSRAILPKKLREEGELALWSTALGEFWTPRGAGGDYVAMLMGEMHALVYDLTSIPASGGIIVDAGANIGVFARWALHNGAQRVVCLEPSPRNAECLRRNLAREIVAGRATVVEKGLWDAATTLSFSAANEANPGTHHVAGDGNGEVTVQVTTLDETCSALELERLDYIKMDVEGAEQRALAGATAAIRRFRPLVCVAVEHTDDIFANGEAVIAQVSGLGCGYRHRVTEAHLSNSPSRGSVLTPYSILFSAGHEP